MNSIPTQWFMDMPATVIHSKSTEMSDTRLEAQSGMQNLQGSLQILIL